MRDFLRIATEIESANWLCTKEGVKTVLFVFNERVKNGHISDEELATILAAAPEKGSGAKSDSSELTVLDGGIGVLPVYGPIFGKANLMTMLSGATSMEQFRADLKTMLADDSIKSIIMDMDTPGGTADMIAEAADEIFAGRDIKPIYAIANNMSGSAGYYLMSQATKVYGTPSSSEGSIGVYTVHKDESAADAKQGYKYTFTAAAPYKLEGNPHMPLSQEGEAFRQEIVNELYGEFKSAVARGRNISVESVESTFGGGRMLPAKRALSAGMIDEIMEFDSLVESVASKSPLQVSFNGVTVPATMNAEGVLTIDMSVADYEHSEPGTGSPPQPKQREDDDIAIDSGSRRPDLTRGLGSEENEPGAPKASAVNNNGGKAMNLEQLMQLFGVDSEDALEKAITEMHTESSALKESVQESARERNFAKDYPEMWERLQNERAITVKRDAQDFVKSVKTIKGHTGLALSAAAMESVEGTYLKFANGEGTLDDFKQTVAALTQQGIVDYSEHGTKLEEELQEYDTTSAVGISNLRSMFAAKVAEIQSKDNLSYAEALKQAALAHPELAKAYQSTSHVRAGV